MSTERHTYRAEIETTRRVYLLAVTVSVLTLAAAVGCYCYGLPARFEPALGIAFCLILSVYATLKWPSLVERAEMEDVLPFEDVPTFMNLVGRSVALGIAATDVCLFMQAFWPAFFPKEGR